jgi:hypothetical protein
MLYRRFGDSKSRAAPPLPQRRGDLAVGGDALRLKVLHHQHVDAATLEGEEEHFSRGDIFKGSGRYIGIGGRLIWSLTDHVDEAACDCRFPGSGGADDGQWQWILPIRAYNCYRQILQGLRVFPYLAILGTGRG